MKSNRFDYRTSRINVNIASAAVVFLPLLLLTGCSSIPEWANPLEWYEDAANIITGNVDKDKRSKVGQIGVGTDSRGQMKFPNLSSVSKRPKLSTVEERKRLSESLLADRKNARYSRSSLLRQVAPTKSSSGVDRKMRAQAPPPIAPPKASFSKRKRGIGVRSRHGPVSSQNLRVPKLFPKKSKKIVGRFDDKLRVKPIIKPPNQRVRSFARVGNPIFGPPPSDITVFNGAISGTGQRQLVSQPPPVPGTQSPGSVFMRKRGATVRFAAGSSTLTAGGRSVLGKVADAYRQRRGGLRIDGHASSRTRDMTMVKHHMVNFNISLKRANAVARELIRQGVASESLFVSAISDSKPIYSEIMPAGDAGNQRVEIYFVN